MHRGAVKEGRRTVRGGSSEHLPCCARFTAAGCPYRVQDCHRHRFWLGWKPVRTRARDWGNLLRGAGPRDPRSAKRNPHRCDRRSHPSDVDCRGSRCTLCLQSRHIGRHRRGAENRTLVQRQPAMGGRILANRRGNQDRDSSPPEIEDPPAVPASAQTISQTAFFQKGVARMV